MAIYKKYYIYYDVAQKPEKSLVYGEFFVPWKPFLSPGEYLRMKVSGISHNVIIRLFHKLLCKLGYHQPNIVNYFNYHLEYYCADCNKKIKVDYK